MKKLFSMLLLLCLVFSFCACGGGDGGESKGSDGALSQTSGTDSEDGRLNIVTTVFAAYDLARQVCGELANVTLLVPAGADPHHYEPSGISVGALTQSDLFVTSGGELGEWAEEMIAMSPEEILVFDMSDYVSRIKVLKTVTQQTHDHDHDHDHEHSHSETVIESFDEHVWTSPSNAAEITEYLCRCVSTLDPANKDIYRQNADELKTRLLELHEEYKDATENATHRELVFSDGCAFAYLCGEYVLPYHQVLDGCNGSTGAEGDDVAAIISLINEKQLPVVFFDELSDQKTADVICRETNAKKLLLHSCHTVTQEELDSGVTYLDLMRQNLQNLKQALG